MSGYTPGPWFLDEIDTGTFEVCGNRTSFCADIVLMARIDNNADARLIAAAPDLLEALERGAHYLRGYIHACGEPGAQDKRVLEAMFAAIAKAKGGDA